MKEVKEKESWNYKRIIIVVFLLITLAIGGFYIKSNYFKDTSSPALSVKGESVEINENLEKEEEININLQDALKERIQNLKKEAGNLNVLDIASSSPEIQKIINDIKGLEEYPQNQFKNICRQLCGL